MEGPSVSLTLPRSGPFAVQGRFLARSIWTAILFLFLGLVVGGALIGYGIHTVSVGLRTVHIWTNGEEAPDATIEGKWTSQKGVRNYELTLEYVTQDGKRQTCKVGFMRFFTGPGQDDPFSARYLKTDPTKATISWAYEARTHQWIWALLAGGIGLLILLGTWYEGIRRLRHRKLVQRLAVEGELIKGEVTDVKTTFDAQSKKTKYIFAYRYERGQTFGGKYTATGEGERPMLLDDDKSIVLLADRQTKDHTAIQHDGSPLELETPAAAPTPAPPPSP